MSTRRLWIVLALVGFVVIGQALEIFPLQVVFVKPEVPTPILLATGTPEEFETVRFLIVESPRYGVLLGIPPALVYVPFPGFVGIDWVSFLVQDAASNKLLDYGTVQLRVLRPEAFLAPALRFEGMFNLSGPSVSLNAYNFLFGLHSRFQYFEPQILASWSQAGFTSFQGIVRAELEGTWPAPWRLPVTSVLTFNPAALSLTSWTVDARTTVLGWQFSYYFYYAGIDSQTNSYTVFSFSGPVGNISLTSRTKFASLSPTFAEEIFTVRGSALCPDCPQVWEAEYVHKKAGFDRLSLILREIPIPCPACVSLQTFLDLKVTFTSSEKRVEPSLRLVAGFEMCMRPLVSLSTPSEGLGIGGLEIWGVEIRCELPNGYRGRFATSFNPERDSSVTGYPHLFELFQLEGPVVPCCGSPGWWQISFYFSRDSGFVFGLAMSDVVVYFPISREAFFHAQLKSGFIDPADPTKTWELALGWKALF